MTAPFGALCIAMILMANTAFQVFWIEKTHGAPLNVGIAVFFIALMAVQAAAFVLPANRYFGAGWRHWT